MTIDSTEKKQLRKLEQRLGYRFRRCEHLKRALTHKSFANEQRLPATDHNERYEYLGDAVLELAVSHLLMQRFPDHAEGELSKLRAAVVNERMLAHIARELDIGEFLYLGKGEERTGGRDKDSLLSDALEAVLGAMFLDRGFEKTLKVIEQYYLPVLAQASDAGFVQDYKTRLQEESQNRFKAIPRYRLLREHGPDHQKTFEVALLIHNTQLSLGQGSSKKMAEQDAARQVLTKILSGEEVL